MEQTVLGQLRVRVFDSEWMNVQTCLFDIYCTGLLPSTLWFENSSMSWLEQRLSSAVRHTSMACLAVAAFPLAAAFLVEVCLDWLEALPG